MPLGRRFGRNLIQNTSKEHFCPRDPNCQNGQAGLVGFTSEMVKLT